MELIGPRAALNTITDPEALVKEKDYQIAKARFEARQRPGEDARDCLIRRKITALRCSNFGVNPMFYFENTPPVRLPERIIEKARLHNDGKTVLLAKGIIIPESGINDDEGLWAELSDEEFIFAIADGDCAEHMRLIYNELATRINKEEVEGKDWKNVLWMLFLFLRHDDWDYATEITTPMITQISRWLQAVPPSKKENMLYGIVTGLWMLRLQEYDAAINVFERLLEENKLIDCPKIHRKVIKWLICAYPMSGEDLSAEDIQRVHTLRVEYKTLCKQRLFDLARGHNAFYTQIKTIKKDPHITSYQTSCEQMEKPWRFPEFPEGFESPGMVGGVSDSSRQRNVAYVADTFVRKKNRLRNNLGDLVDVISAVEGMGR